MKLVLTILTAITLNNAALFIHYEYANKVYENCYYNAPNEDIEACMNKDTTFRVVGTILFTEGSYLQGKL
jgi:hypothetical protein